ncbi:hypothetical protein JTB14_038201 [Gonioctena quinquepunctata]|nr:hypothetical protein JTB14_038201 [Gonioctena quinquepunctata]
MDTQKYPKSTTLAGGSKGITYQIKLLALFALEAAHLDNWQLSTENEKAGKLDDIVIQSINGDLLIQCKHKKQKQSLLGKEFWSINPKNDDFGLPKYFSSFVNIKENFKNIELVIICTNIDLDEKQDIFKEESRSTYLLQREKKSYEFNIESQAILKEKNRIGKTSGKPNWRKQSRNWRKT